MTTVIGIDLDALLNRWQRPAHQPFRSGLIDWCAHIENRTSLNCMDATGQLLYVFGGWSHEQLRRGKVLEADRALADLLNISLPHAMAIRLVNDQGAFNVGLFISDPASFIPNCETLFRFWHTIDSFDNARWAKSGALHRGADWRYNVSTARQNAERNGSAPIARVVSQATRSSACSRSWDVLRDAEGAALEIIGAPGKGVPSAYPMLRLFHLAGPHRLSPLPRDYGVLRHA